MALAYKAVESYSTAVSTAEVYTRDGDLYKGIPGEGIKYVGLINMIRNNSLMIV